MPSKIDDLIHFLEERGCKLRGRTDALVIDHVAHCEDARKGTLSWFRGTVPPAFWPGVIMIGRDVGPRTSPYLYAACEDPRRIVAHVLSAFFPRLAAQPCQPEVRGSVHPTAVIGAEGANYLELGGGRASRFPSVGSVRVGKWARVGPCATVMRGSTGDTVIGEDVYIGNGVNVGHDVRIGPHTLIVAHASLGGWVRVGRHVRIYQGALIKNGVTIGDRAVVGMGATVIEDVEPGTRVVGNPARPIE